MRLAHNAPITLPKRHQLHLRDWPEGTQLLLHLRDCPAYSLSSSPSPRPAPPPPTPLSAHRPLREQPSSPHQLSPLSLSPPPSLRPPQEINPRLKAAPSPSPSAGDQPSPALTPPHPLVLSASASTGDPRARRGDARPVRRHGRDRAPLHGRHDHPLVRPRVQGRRPRFVGLQRPRER
eukprot:7272900-Prymnesium_polylepis.2